MLLLLKKMTLSVVIILSVIGISHAKCKDMCHTTPNLILSYVNQYRAHLHLPPLKMDARISSVAQRHSQNMAMHRTQFGHNHFINRIEVLKEVIPRSEGGAENVAYNYKSAKDAVRNWLKSPEHRKNIEGNYNLSGVGIARDRSGRIYYTQIFLKTA